MMTTLPARDARRLMKSAIKQVAASGPTGACVVRRTGRNPKVLCEVMSRSECTWIDNELQADGKGHATFFAGKTCPV